MRRILTPPPHLVTQFPYLNPASHTPVHMNIYSPEKAARVINNNYQKVDIYMTAKNQGHYRRPTANRIDVQCSIIAHEKG